MTYRPKSEDEKDRRIAEKFIGQVLDKRFVIREIIDFGGMSYVFKGWHLNLKCDIAIKILKKDFLGMAGLVQRFKSEAVTIARVDDPRIVKVHDQGEHYLEGLNWLYLVMEYLPGATLDEIIDEKAPFSQQEAYYYMSLILQGLQKAHDRGIIHRDLKPGNVKIVGLTGEQVRIKILDFGISRFDAGNGLSESQLTKVGELFGTPHFMSPEQAQGLEQIDKRTDIYSAGIIIYNMLTGKRPFDADNDNPASILALHISMNPPKPSLCQRGISSELDEVVMKAIAKDPNQRFQSADEFRRALRKAVFSTDDEPVVYSIIPPLSKGHERVEVPAAPPAPVDFASASTVVADSEQLGRRKKKFPVRIIFAAAIVLGIMVGLGIILFSGSKDSKTTEEPKKDAIVYVVEEKPEDKTPPEPVEPVETPVYKPVETSPSDRVGLVTVKDLSQATRMLWNNNLKPHQGKKSCSKVLSTVERIVDNNPGFADGHFWLYQCLKGSDPAKASRHRQKYQELTGQ